MRGLGWVALAAALLGPGAARAAPDDPGAALRSAAEQCLASNAARVSASTQTLTEAVSFLVDDLCAEQITHVSQYRTNMKTIAALQANPPQPQFTASAERPVLGAFEDQQNASAARQTELIKQLKVDPATGELITPPGFDSTLSLRSMAGSIFQISITQSEFKASAAKAVLAAKEAAAKH